jgi:hypothetical protein
VIFRTDADGWTALEHEIDRVVAGESRFYTVNSTLKEFGRKYATSPIWVRNVAKMLGVEVSTPLFIILDTPPVVDLQADKHALAFIFQQ